jgi:hypothetical protein
MGIQSFVPASGGGMPGASYIASIQMTTYNRTWNQLGGPGDYVLVSSNLSNGYAYFTYGGTTTGVPLGRIINLSSGFTKIDVIAPKDDYIMLYKVATKTTTEFANPFAAFSSFGSPITSSGNFVLPNNALPLVNILVVGGGAGGGRHGGGGGGGGNVVKLTAFQAVGTTGVTIGNATGYQGRNAGATYFGNVYALGGGFGGNHNETGGTNGNGGGGGGHGTAGNGGSGTTQTASSGLGTAGAPAFYGGFNGARASGGEPGGGGAGAGGSASANISTHARQGGPGHASDISGSTQHYSVGGGAGSHSSSPGNHGGANWSRGYYGMGGHGGSGDNGGYDPGTNNSQGTEGGQGIVIVRYYIP